MAPEFRLRAMPRLLWDTYYAWRRDKATLLSAAITYYALFSLAPLLIIAIAIAGAVFDPDLAQEQVVQEIGRLTDPNTATIVAGVIERTRQSTSGPIATAFGLVILVFGASRIFIWLQIALNMIWEVEPGQRQGTVQVIRDHLVSFLTVLGVGLALTASMIVGTVLSISRGRLESALAEQKEALVESMPSLGEQTEALAEAVPALPEPPVELPHSLLPILESVRSLQLVDLLMTLAIAALLFALVFRFLPDTRIAWRDVWPGALVTAALFAVGKLAIGFYLTYAGVASTYGAAGSLVVLLLWFNYSAQIFFFGAEFTKIYATRYGSRTPHTAQADVPESPGVLTDS